MPRLVDLLARNLGCSRTRARAALAAGAIAGPDGAPLTDPRASVPAERLPWSVTVDGRPFVLHDEAHVLLHKPVGVVTALRDERHRTALALLAGAPLFGELRPVGRLDLDTSGLLLWTTDGAFLQRLTHPRRAVPRTYHAALARPFTAPPPGFALADGHRPAIAALAPIAAEAAHPALLRPAEASTFARITLEGGAYHEVRRIFAALGSHVLALCRVSFGRLELPRDLPAGAWRPIAREDV